MTLFLFSAYRRRKIAIRRWTFCEVVCCLSVICRLRVSIFKVFMLRTSLVSLSTPWHRIATCMLMPCSYYIVLINEIIISLLRQKWQNSGVAALACAPEDLNQGVAWHPRAKRTFGRPLKSKSRLELQDCRPTLYYFSSFQTEIKINVHEN